VELVRRVLDRLPEEVVHPIRCREHADEQLHGHRSGGRRSQAGDRGPSKRPLEYCRGFAARALIDQAA
jgi:hypothetical protein